MQIKTKCKTGFTLVELSIVLVIIGLLIGGILASQSMISTTKIQKAVRQLQQYDTAIANFYTKYNQMPGDSNLFTPAGDNDKDMIGEDAFGWAHLSQGVGLKNYLGNDYTATALSDPLTEAECPRLDIDQDKTESRCLAISWRNGWAKLTYRYMEGSIFNAPTLAPLKPKDLLAIDKKMDDGLAESGDILNVSWGSETTPACNSGDTYLVDNSYGCTMFYKVGLATGVSYP